MKLLHKLSHYFGRNTASYYNSSVRGCGYDYYICDTCVEVCDEPHNQALVDFLYLIFTPLRVTQSRKDEIIDGIMQKIESRQ